MSAVLTVAELAAELRCGIHQAYGLVERGEIRSVRVGRAIRIPRHALDEFLGYPNADQAQGGEAAPPDAPKP